MKRLLKFDLKEQKIIERNLLLPEVQKGEVLTPSESTGNVCLPSDIYIYTQHI
jgi:hypothetical protein